MDFLQKDIDCCILIPCYNDEAGLINSLKSVCYNFEKCLAVVVDDGSKNALSAAKLMADTGTGLQIFVIRLLQNSGITKALNTGLQWILQNTRAPYIARLDCQDVCAPQRFGQQVAYLNENKDIGLLGSWCYFNEAATGYSYAYKTPLHHTAIEKAMHQRNVFMHPTVMFRAALIKAVGLYPEDYPHAEDYALFWQLMKKSKVAVLNQFLVTCAIVRSGISYQHRQAQLKGRKKVIEDFSDRVLIKFFGLIRIYFLMMVPKALLLRLKALKGSL